VGIKEWPSFFDNAISMLRIAKAFCLQKFVVLVQKNTAFQIKIA
jgi:hypothetical protein